MKPTYELNTDARNRLARYHNKQDIRTFWLLLTLLCVLIPVGYMFATRKLWP